MPETVSRNEWDMLVKKVDDMAADVRKIGDGVTEALTRLNHPDPQACTQQEDIAALKRDRTELFQRVNALEQWRARILGIVTAVSVALTLLLSWIGKCWFDFWQQQPKP